MIRLKNKNVPIKLKYNIKNLKDSLQNVNYCIYINCQQNIDLFDKPRKKEPKFMDSRGRFNNFPKLTSLILLDSSL